MPTPRLTDEQCLQAVTVWRKHYKQRHDAAAELGIHKATLDHRLNVAAQRGMLLDEAPAMPGFRITRVANGPRGQTVEQKPETGEPFAVPEGHTVKGVSALTDGQGNTLAQWTKTAVDSQQREEALRAFLDGLKDEVPRAEPFPPTSSPTLSDLLSQYTITDTHLGMLAWHEEAGEDYDLKGAEDLLRRFFSAAVDMSPNSETAILAQLGDFLHYDSHKSVTPEHGHLLDTDSRFPKVVRTAIRVLRWAVSCLLAKHDRVHMVIADANHDPASAVWMRETFAAFFEDEPRVSVDTSASTYYCYEHGKTALFYHHGHRKKPKDVDSVFARDFREVYGRTTHAYAHMGHLHSDEILTTNLMKVEQHETLAAKDAYASHGGWRAGRSAKVIHYHKTFGEVSRSIITPEMLAV